MEKEKITRNLGLHSLFKSISNSFISLFVPLIVYNQLGYQMAILYLISVSLLTTLVPLLLKSLIKKHPIVSICIHIICAVSVYLIVALVEMSMYVLLLVAAVSGVGGGLYNSAITAIISSNKSKNGFSSFKVWQYIGAFLIVLFNGYVLNLGGKFSVLITGIVSLLLYIISIIPFFVVIKHINLETEQMSNWRNFLIKTRKHNIFSALFGLQDLIFAYIIPLYLAINNLSIDKIAIIVAIINIAKILLTMLANLIYKKGHSMLAVTIGAILVIVSSGVIALSTHNVLLYIMSVVGNLAFPFFYIPTLNEFQKDIDGHYAEGMIVREVNVHMLSPIVLFPFLFISNLAWIIGFGIIVAIGIFFAGLLIFKKQRA
jgi:hypothetical protein